MKLFRKILLPCLAALIAVAVLACGSYNDNTADKQPVEGIERPEQIFDEESCASLSDKIIVYDDNGEESDMGSVDNRSYDGFLFTSDGDVETSERVRHVADNLYAADSLGDIADASDVESIGYIEPDYDFELFESVETLPYEPDTDDDGFGFELMGGWSPNPNDKYYKAGKMYNMNMIDVSGAWSYNVYGQSADRVVVSVIDSGMFTGHEDIDYTHILKGKSYIEGSSTYDGYSHGTMVTGIILASQNNSKGVAGCAPGAYVMPMKVFNSSGKSDGEGIFKAISDSIDAGADVINMSLGTKNYSYTFRTLCEKADSKGIILVAAAGNNGNSTIEYPAAFDCVIGVGSVGPSGTRSSFSETGKSVDVAAPGENLYGVYNSDKTPYAICNGTSFACPQVSALAAMVKSIDKSYNTAKFFRLLKKTSSNYTQSGGAKWNSKTGYGIINCRKVIETVLSVYTDIEDAEVSLDSVRLPYDGLPKKPAVTVKAGGKTLKKGTDYTVTYRDNTEIGTARVILSGKGKVRGAVYAEFEIFEPYCEVTASVGSDGRASVSDSLLDGMLSEIRSGQYISGRISVPSDFVSLSLKISFLEKAAPYGLRISSLTGSVTLDEEAIEKIRGSVTGSSVTVVFTGEGSVSFIDEDAWQDDELLQSSPLSQVPANLSLVIPSEILGRTVCAVDDNSNPIYGITVGDEFRFRIGKTGTYRIVTADSYAKKAASAVSLKAASTGISSSKVRVKVTGSMTKIKNMGYTVKYKYYYSTSRTKGYKLKKSSTAGTYTFTGLKKGKTYYFKVKAVAVDARGKEIASTKYSAVTKRKL